MVRPFDLYAAPLQFRGGRYLNRLRTGDEGPCDRRILLLASTVVKTRKVRSTSIERDCQEATASDLRSPA